MKKVVLLLNTNNRSHNAGPKAQIDISTFLHKQGFKKIELYVNSASLFSKLFAVCITIPRFVSRIKDADELVIQYPMSRFLFRRLVNLLRLKTRIKVFCVVHDIESLRLKQDDEPFKKGEMTLMNSVDGLIIHTPNMLKWLRKNGLKVNAVPLYLFDYNNKQPLNNSDVCGRSVCFAGNLKKSTFLLKLHPEKFDLDLYGSGYMSKIQDGNIHYKGSFFPEQLPKYLTQSFGLVWDGNSVNSCSDKYGQYIKYNSPHKAALYLSCGIPVIIWEKAGIADYIVNHKLGIAISSLKQLDNVLSNFDNTYYQELRNNCIEESKRLRKGYYIRQAIHKLEEN